MSPYRESAYLKVVLGALSLAISLTVFSYATPGMDRIRPVPKASCGPQDRMESVQGQTTLAERFNPGPPKAYNCNLELVGQFEGEGASTDIEVFDDCAYYSTAPNPTMRHPGVAVLDVSDPRNPTAIEYLDSPAMLKAHESLEISLARKLLLASNMPSTFDIYDISNCRSPILKSSLNLPDGLVSHGGQFTADGLMFYGAKWDPSDPKIFALDTSDPSHPRRIAAWVPQENRKSWITHGAVLNKEASRAYVAMKRMTDDRQPFINPNGLAIFDISDIQARRPNAQFRLISTLFWDDTHGAEGMVTVTIDGRPYLIFSDNLGTIGWQKPVPPDACGTGKPGHGFARIIDVSDERNPKTVSKLALEVSDPSNCSKSVHDPTLYGAYGSFACSVDNDENGKLLACGNFEGGLRVFDIRNPISPREVAYYKPPARRTENRPGSLFRPQSGPARDNTADSVIVAPRFRKNAEEIWFTSADNGFQVVRFSDRFKAVQKDLFLK
jgi:hypothetical protein